MQNKYSAILPTQNRQDLSNAIRNQDLEQVQRIVEDPNNPLIFDDSNPESDLYLLHLAYYRYNNKAITKYLVSKGLIYYEKDDIPLSAFRYAIDREDLEMLKTFIIHNYDPTPLTEKLTIEPDFFSYNVKKTLLEDLTAHYRPNILKPCLTAVSALKGFDLPNDLVKKIIFSVRKYDHIPPYKDLLDCLNTQISAREILAYKRILPYIVLPCASLVLGSIMDMRLGAILGTSALSIEMGQYYARRNFSYTNNVVENLNICMDIKTLKKHANNFVNSTKESFMDKINSITSYVTSLYY